jgi:ABC-type glycerol-3-phosphate transport system substrate-binding protein
MFELRKFPRFFELRWLVVGLLALATMACRSGATDDDRPGSPRKIIYWEKWTGFEGEAMGRVVKLFNERQRERAKREPGYRPIEVKQVTVSKIDQKLMVAIAGGNPPDVSGSISFWLPSFVDKGALVDITDRLERAGLAHDHFSPAFYELGEYRGRMWATPTTPSGLALYYNERLFREAGLDPNAPPKTIEELDAFAEKMTKWEVTHDDGSKTIERGYLPNVPDHEKRLIQVGFLPSEPGLWQWAWGFYFGGQLVRGDKITAAEPANVRAFEWVASYSKKLGVDKIQRFRSGFGNSASTVASPQNPFLSGKVAMEVQGVWMFNFIEQYAPALEWKAAAFPHPADRPDLYGPTDVDADQLVIPTGSKHPDEAFEFIAFASSQEAMEILCLGQKKHSPLLTMSDEFRAKHPHPYLELFHSLSSSPGRYSAPRVGVYNEYLRALVGAIDEIQNLRTPPKQALEAVQVRVQKAYDRELASVRRRSGAGKNQGGAP